MKRTAWSSMPGRAFALFCVLGIVVASVWGAMAARAAASVSTLSVWGPSTGHGAGRGGPTIGTRLSSRTVAIGTAVRDSASFGGRVDSGSGDGDGNPGDVFGRWRGAAAGGTVSYTVYPSLDACERRSGGTSEGTVTVSHGDVPSSRWFTPASVGTFYWQAVYSGDSRNGDWQNGDSRNHGSSSACRDEQLTVTKAIPTISTIPSAGVAVGGTVWDRASLRGAYRPTGRIAFRLYRDRGCSERVFGSRNALRGTIATSGAYATTRTGTYYWRARYAGDRNNTASTSPCGVGHETVVVNGSGRRYAIGGDVAVPLYPGAAPQPIDVTFRTPTVGSGGGGFRVSHLTVAIDSVTGGSNTPYRCTAADFVLTQYSGTYPFSVPDGTSSLSTIFPSLPATSYPSIRMIDRHDSVPGDGTGNQDGCEGATIHLTYAGTP